MEAIRTCTNSEDKLNPETDETLIRKCIKKGHDSVLEHIVYSFKITDVSRAVLQEIVRHRTGSFSVLSTRWALNKALKKKKINEQHLLTGDFRIDNLIYEQLEKISELKNKYPHIKNDSLKYALPEAFYTNLLFTIDARNLRNLLFLRLAPDALKEFKNLALALFEAIPPKHRMLFTDTFPDSADNLKNIVKKLKKKIKKLQDALEVQEKAIKWERGDKI